MKRTLSLAGSLLMIALCSGCPAVGVLADKLVGPRPIDPVYEFGKLTQVLVIAENYRAPSQDASDGTRLSQLVSDALIEKQAATIVSQEKLALVRDSRPGAFSKMSVVDVGKAVGAQKVLYIDFGGIGVGAQQGSDMLKGVAHANLKVIDVAAGEVAFPKDMSDGIPVSYETPMRRATDVTNADAMRAETLVGLSGKISRMFFKYVPSDIEAIDQGR